MMMMVSFSVFCAWVFCQSVMRTFDAMMVPRNVFQYLCVTCNPLLMSHEANYEMRVSSVMTNAPRRGVLLVTPHCRRPPRWNRTPCWWAPHLAGPYRNRHSSYCHPAASPWQSWFEQCSLSDYRRRWSPICGACELLVAFSLAFVGPVKGNK